MQKFALALGFVLFGVPNASADLIYAIDFDAPTYNVAPGSMFDVKVILTETATGGDTARLAVGGDDGITSFGLELDYSAVTGGATGASLSGLGDVAINEAVFDDTFFNETTLDSGVKLATALGFTIDAFTGGEFAAVSPNVYRVELATFSFTASGVGGEQTTLSLSDIDLFFDDTAFADFFAADDVIAFGSATVLNSSAAAVPEPSTFAAMGLATLGFFGHRYRQRKKQCRAGAEEHCPSEVTL